MSRHLLPDAALDGRLCVVGISGSGKSTTAKGGVERLLEQGRRVCIVDLLDGWWGLRLRRDGKSPAFPVAIFGGLHGDLPLTEHAGSLIGQAVAQSEGSSIVSLAELDGDAPRRRFALAFFDALHKTNRAPLHLIVDEADFYAPQQPVKDGPGPMLLNRVKEIAARGRMRGFRLWSVTQRPAKLHKDVMSQADTLVAMQLTSSQDRGALKAWIGDQGDESVGAGILRALPSLKRGEGVVWSPRLGVLETTHFPLPDTYDSSRTPEYGETAASVELKPIDLGVLREKLGKVDAEVRANDPTALKAEIARLKGDLAKKPAAVPDAAALTEAHERGYAAGQSYAFDMMAKREKAVRSNIENASGALQRALDAIAIPELPRTAPAPAPGITHRPEPFTPALAARPEPTNPSQSKPNAVRPGLSRPQQRILDALAWLESIGIGQADRTRVAMLADASPKSSGFEKNVSTLKTAALIEYPFSGELRLTQAGREAANAPTTPPTNAELHAAIRSKISGPQWALLEALIRQRVPLSRAELAAQAGVSAASSGFEKNVSTLSGFGFVTYPERGCVQVADILFVER
ncbi:MAG: hypothetical protein ACK4JB_20150 [Reyranella sp.]